MELATTESVCAESATTTDHLCYGNSNFVFDIARNINIVNGLITVNAGQDEYYEITVPSNTQSATVSGSFTASGGSGNDIIVSIMDYTDYVNWQNGHNATAYYTSGKETTGTISAILPGGVTYYLVYDNQFLLSLKGREYSGKRRLHDKHSNHLHHYMPECLLNLSLLKAPAITL